MSKMMTPEGVLRFHVDLTIPVEEMRDWPDVTIGAFFDGIARAQMARQHGARVAAEVRAYQRERATSTLPAHD